MRSAARESARPAGRFERGLLLVLLGLVCAGCSDAPISPVEPEAVPWLGTWTGAIVSEAIGSGTATIVLDAQVGPKAAPLLSGTWRFSFQNQAFSTAGPVVANLNSEKTMLGITFDRSTVPCPGEAGGAADRALLASLTLAGRRLRGSYVVGGCPGGTLDLVQQ